MRKKLKALISLLTMAALMLPMAVMPVFAEGEETSDKYTAPETPSVTYNMNLDWKFFDTKDTQKGIQELITTNVDSKGKKFYEMDFDDSKWETVSIPHAPGALQAFNAANFDAGGGYRSVLFYRKTFTVPNVTDGTKIFFELEGIRQAAYVWVNGQKVGYYEAGIAPMGFDITNYVTPGQQAVIAICNDGTTARGTSYRIPYETIPGDEWGSSYTPDNYKSTSKTPVGAQYVWNTKDFNEPVIGLVYDAYLHIKGNVYQTLPLYNNLKTQGNYIYATDFDIKQNKATIHVDAEVRNESSADGNYTLQVDVVDHEGKLAYTFKSTATEVKKATDAGVVYETAVENDVYSDANIANPNGITDINSPDVTSIKASFAAEDVRFWSIDDPYLYTVYTTLLDGTGKAVDVQEKKTGFRKIEYSATNGILLNDTPVWLKGYAQRSTNEWAVLGVSPDWLEDYDMALLKENNSNFIRWMHVAPKPYEVRSSDKYGVAVVCPAGDKEGSGLTGRGWSQKVEAMRDAMIYFRNSPSVFFWETENSDIGGEANANEMAAMREKVDPEGMRFIGARSTKNVPSELNYEWNYAGTMYGNYAGDATAAMKTNGIMGPIMETEYARDEAPRRVWDVYSPPDYDYVNKYISKGGKYDGADVWNETQEDITVNNVKEYSRDYYQKRMGSANSVYSAAAMMVWSDSNMHTRNTATENCRTTGRVDPVRQTKEMFEGTRVAQSETPAVHIIGHWSYPKVASDGSNYFYYGTNQVALDGSHSYEAYDTTKKYYRDPTKKTVYAIGSKDVKKIELYRVDGETETKIGEDDAPEQLFIYQFDNVDVTQGDAVIAKAYNARNDLIATDEIKRTGDAVKVELKPHTAPDGWKADGADIAYFDVQVLDANGNICALNYDKIEFTNISGEGVFLGGYNSGSGSGCFQNTSGSAGLSNYFGGAKDGVSTIGKNYVYAENGTNRIFVKSTRTAGEFKISVKMEGMQAKEYTLTSEAVTSEGGLTTEMPATLDPGVSSERPVVRNVTPMMPLMKTAYIVDWTKAVTETVVDTNEYYDLKYAGVSLGLEGTARARMGSMNAVFGPVLGILGKLKTDGAVDYTYTGGVLTFTPTGGATYTIEAGKNFIASTAIDGGQTEIVQSAESIGDELFVSLAAVLGYIPGVTVTTDTTGKTVNVTYASN